LVSQLTVATHNWLAEGQLALNQTASPSVTSATLEATGASPNHDDSAIGQLIERLHANIASVVLGKPEVIRTLLVGLIAEGHLLIEDVPGIGKTLLAKALAFSLGNTFHRIQFTPDLLPSDLIGTSIYHQASGEFIFKPGPLFAQVILADEINRTTPRTQSALLEAMNDRQVTVDGKTWPLGPPFMVLATQNPYEFEGTYPLPESQLDRFLMRLRVGYPERDAEKDILVRHREGEPVNRLQAVLSTDQVVAMQHAARRVRVDDALNDYILDLVSATRDHAEIYLGASTRASLGLYRAAQALALLEGRNYVVPDDIKTLAAPVLAHRLLTKSFRRAGQRDSGESIVSDIVQKVAIPI
jgi:MoxR-like ATPase